MKVRKAVIPAAGYGTRMLPATKAMPKELIPIVDKPAIQYIVEEAVKSGIEDILIILSRGKTEVEDHFDRSPELEERLFANKNFKDYEELKKITELANIVYIRQKEIKGLGHAVYCSKPFIGNEPFAVLYGDDVIMEDSVPVTKQLINVYDEYKLGTAGIKMVSREMIKKYSSLLVEPCESNVYKVLDMIEKPNEGEEYSLFSILGRVILPPSIFNILENTPVGACNEIQLTDAMKLLAKTEGMMAVDFVGTRYDMGNKLSVMQAGVETALKHPEIGTQFKEYLKSLINKI